MSAIVMDGAAVARQLLHAVAVDASTFERARGRKACLATVLVGDDPASHTYVRMKADRCRAAGLDSRRHDVPGRTSTADVVRLVAELSADTHVDGILVQHPMPAHIAERRVFDAIDPAGSSPERSSMRATTPATSATSSTPPRPVAPG